MDSQSSNDAIYFKTKPLTILFELKFKYEWNYQEKK